MGISADPVDRQRHFDEKNSLGFTLLSDPGNIVAKAFGIKRRGPMPPKRATFVIGSDRRLVKAILSETDMWRHADDALDALKALA